MRRLLLLSVIIVGVLGAASVQALPTIYTYTLEPTPNDLWDLSHDRAYSWGFDLLPTSKYEIVEASLTFHNIRNWREEENWLYISLLDNPVLGTRSYDDGFSSNTDYFTGQGTYLTTWQDIPGGGDGIDLTYTFSSEGWLGYLNDYAQNGRAGFGFDPDCHFNNDGVTFEVAQAVPEPLTLTLFGFGLVGVGLARRRKNR